MFIMAAGRGYHGVESVEDQVSVDVGGVVQASKPDLMARGVALDLLQMAKRVARSTKLPNMKICLGENLTLDRIVTDDRRSHRALR